MHFENLVEIIKKEVVRDRLKISKLASTMCKNCHHVKQIRVEFRAKENSTSKSLEVVHIDLCGPMRTKGLNGEQYFMLLINDYTRIIWVFFLKNKLEAFECFRIYKDMVENEIDLKIKFLRSNNGGECMSKGFQHFCEEKGIKIQFSTARTP